MFGRADIQISYRRAWCTLRARAAHITRTAGAHQAHGWRASGACASHATRVRIAHPIKSHASPRYMSEIPWTAEKYEVVGEFDARCVKVYDGDTIHIIAKPPGFTDYRKFSCRLARINAPEIRDGDEQSRAAAAAARTALFEKILGKVVSINALGSDKYGRILVEVTSDNVNMSDYMLESGYAQKY